MKSVIFWTAAAHVVWAVVMCLAVALGLYLSADYIDHHGGVKALVDRVWAGQPTPTPRPVQYNPDAGLQ